jgi:hypothetical protein
MTPFALTMLSLHVSTMITLPRVPYPQCSPPFDSFNYVPAMPVLQKPLSFLCICSFHVPVCLPMTEL